MTTLKEVESLLSQVVGLKVKGTISLEFLVEYDQKDTIAILTEKLNKAFSPANMKWGVLTNTFPTAAKIKEINRTISHDGKWHTIFEEPDQVHIDGVTIRRKTQESMT